MVEEKLGGEKMANICLTKPYEKVFSEGEQRKYGYWKAAYGTKRSSILATRGGTQKRGAAAEGGTFDIGNTTDFCVDFVP